MHCFLRLENRLSARHQNKAQEHYTRSCALCTTLRSFFMCHSSAIVTIVTTILGS